MMQQDKYTMFRNRLAKVLAHRQKTARRQGVSCYRLYDLDLPEFPLAIDLYGQWVHVAEYQRKHALGEAEHREWLELSTTCITEVLNVNPDHVFMKARKVISDRSDQYGKVNDGGMLHEVWENGLRFLVNFTDYLDTGLFLDHRPTRSLVGEMSEGKAVLNLFAYTGSFSVYAARGKASRVHTMDMSNTYIDWARRNFRLNGLDDSKYDFSTTDVMAALPGIWPGSYDLIICDPPTFSNSKKMAGVFDVQKDHPALINYCLRALTKNGTLLFSTNNRRFRLYDHHIETDRIKDITRQTTGFDFVGKQNRLCYRIEKPTAQVPV